MPLKFIIYDIEATCWGKYAPPKQQETIEIGALMLDRYGEVQDTFHRYVRPKLNPLLSNYCFDLTGLEQETIDRAAYFPDVAEDFQDWIEVFDEDYMLCSWGSFDQKILMSDCDLYNMETKWLEPYMNLRRQYQTMKRSRRNQGLKYVVEKEGFEFTGTNHEAIADAENLAKVFIKYLDDWVY